MYCIQKIEIASSIGISAAKITDVKSLLRYLSPEGKQFYHKIIKDSSLNLNKTKHHFFPKTFSNDPHQLVRWKFFLASIGKNFLVCRKKIDWFPTAADKLINNNIIFVENYMISVPSTASWEFRNQILTKSVEY